MIRVLYIEDDPVSRELTALELNRSPGIFHCQTAADWPAGLKAITDAIAADRVMDVVLLDHGLPGPDGPTAAREIKERWPQLKIIMYTGNERPAKIMESLSAGADGYLFKSAPREALAAAIVKVHGGNAVFSNQVKNEIVKHFHRRTPLLASLSPTEKEILQRLDRGQTYKQAASEMNIAITTLKTHAKRILVKTLADSMSEAAWLRRQPA